VAPSSVPAGAQTTLTATLKNRSSYDKLGSADITVPSGLTGVSVADPPGYATATLSGGVIKVRDAKLAPGSSLAIAITATAPCGSGTLAWSATAKTESYFYLPGSPMTLDVGASHLTTTVTGACALRFVSIASGQTTFDVTAPANAAHDAGFLAISNATGPNFDCAGYKELTATPTTIVGPDRTKTVTATIDRHVLSAQHRTPSSLQMCFGAPYPFATRHGSYLTSVDTNGDSVADFFDDLLPDCGAAPCVAKRKQNEDCDGIIVVKAPGGPQDPAYRP
jgi:hypothetical protein